MIIKNKYFFSILIIYLILTITLNIINNNLYINIINPIFWTFMLIITTIYLKKNYIRINTNKKYLLNLITITIIFLLLYFYLGFIIGFTNNSYNHNLITIYINIVPIISIEILKGILIKNHKKSKLIVALITILFILLEIDYHSITKLYFTKELLFKYDFSKLISLIVFSLISSFFSLNYSYKLSLFFRTILRLTYILLPILPSLNWYMMGSISLIGVTIIYLIFKYKLRRDFKIKKINSFALISYAFTLVFATFLITFMSGFLKYEPIAILSNSMVPTLSKGDILVYKKLNSQELTSLKIGDIIVYKKADIYIAHRIYKVIKQDNKTFYLTKGDNNKSVDNLEVEPNDIKGLVKLKIKYFGYPSVYLHEYFNKYEKDNFVYNFNAWN